MWKASYDKVWSDTGEGLLTVNAVGPEISGIGVSIDFRFYIIVPVVGRLSFSIAGVLSIFHVKSHAPVSSGRTFMGTNVVGGSVYVC